MEAGASLESVRLGLSHANEATTRQYVKVKVKDVAIGQAQLIRSTHFGGQAKASSSASDYLDENFFNQAFEEFVESEEFEQLCSQPSLSLSQCKKARFQVSLTFRTKDCFKKIGVVLL